MRTAKHSPKSPSSILAFFQSLFDGGQHACPLIDLTEHQWWPRLVTPARMAFDDSILLKPVFTYLSRSIDWWWQTKSAWVPLKSSGLLSLDLRPALAQESEAFRRFTEAGYRFTVLTTACETSPESTTSMTCKMQSNECSADPWLEGIQRKVLVSRHFGPLFSTKIFQNGCSNEWQADFFRRYIPYHDKYIENWCMLDYQGCLTAYFEWADSYDTKVRWAEQIVTLSMVDECWCAIGLETSWKDCCSDAANWL